MEVIKNFLASLLSSLLGLGVCLLVLEAGVRLYDNVPVFSFENYVAKAFVAVRQEGISRFDPKFGWAQESNVKILKPGGLFVTDALGIRMPNETVREPKEGSLLATGDSLTVGSEVNNSESWPAQLEGMIGIDVINAGNGGYSVDQTMMRTEELTKKLKPRAVIVEVMGITSMYNGLKVYGGAPKPYYTIENDKLVLHNSPVPRLPEGASGLGILRDTLGYSYLAKFIMTRLDMLQWWIAAPQRYQWATSAEEGLKISCLLMKKLAELRDAHKIEAAVLIQYGGTEITADTIGWNRQMLVNCIQEQKLTLIDAYEPLRSVYKTEGEEKFKQLWVMHDGGKAYGHMSAAGNQLIAKIIAERMFEKTVR